jgi:flavin reductase (DIM6/NTAB) family NADH-FMN oxidoreductase RutF
MERIDIGANSLFYPMPVTLVGALVHGRPNFLAVAWVSRVNLNPPILAVALNKVRHTAVGVQENQTFSVNVPGADLVKETDYCGIVSGKEVDKSGLFEVFYGELKTAPMIKRCPMCMECRLIETVSLPTHNLFLGDVVGAYTEERYLTDGKLDIGKVNPFLFSRIDNSYWILGEEIGKAYSIGKQGKGQGK